MTVIFGDKPVEASVKTVIRKTAQMSSVNERAKSFIIYNSYVDEINGSMTGFEEAK